ncbi:NAD(P)H-dependent oxidoreductase [Spirosoma flavus]
MNILIIYSHPSKKSYRAQVLEELTHHLTEQNWNVEISDLYAMNFRSDMTEEEFEREGYANLNLPVPEDVLAEHKKIEKADCIIFIYPVWWSDCPAKLKGWFDRVYSVGYAYGYKPESARMKTINYGLVVCTAGHPNDVLKEINIAQSMETVMLNDRLGKRFLHKEMLILGGSLELEKVRQVHSEEIKEITKKIKNYCA